MTSKKRQGLGRGLDALLGKSASIASEATGQQGELRELPIDQLQRGRYQPRREMDPEALEELAQSIRSQGIMQPIIVRPLTHDQHEIIAGERRWRAARLAGLDTVPVLVREIPDEAAVAMALIENIQREDLNPLEEAQALHRLSNDFQLTHQELAALVGKSRATVTNLLRLLALADEVKRLLVNGDLEMGHARALLSLDAARQREAARLIVAKGLSVRQTEDLVRSLTDNAGNHRGKKLPAAQVQPDIQRLEENLSERLGAAVSIQHRQSGKGSLVIRYNTLDELDGILAHLQ